ncbi:predicted protein [Streptomyces sp. C]|nr:predicted protein [Streptomyces sp. C]
MLPVEGQAAGGDVPGGPECQALREEIAAQMIIVLALAPVEPPPPAAQRARPGAGPVPLPAYTQPVRCAIQRRAASAARAW